ncbi:MULTISPECIES: hypothetical protein [unclassified Moorena]|nr:MULTISPECIES: hypothetical protein [unclassified Moorena]
METTTTGQKRTYQQFTKAATSKYIGAKARCAFQWADKLPLGRTSAKDI